MVDAKTLHWVFSVPVGITISIFGLLGNILSIIIWKNILKRNLAGNRSTAIYLLVLCIVDAGLLLFFLLTDSLPGTFSAVLKTKAFCTFFSYFGFPFFFFFIVASIWMVVGVTINRFIMVAFPLKARTWCSKVRAFVGIAAILSCSFIINIPHFFNYRPQEVNGTYKSGPTEYSETGGAQRYEFWVHCMFLVLAPWALVAFFNAGIIYSITKRGQKIAQKYAASTKSQRNAHDKQMTAMLLSVTFAFLVLLAWQCITQCFFMLGYGKGSGRWDIVDKSFALAKLGVVINSSINFLLYCMTGSTFRKELHLLFLRPRRQPRSSSSSAGNTGTRVTTDSSTLNTRL